MVSRDIIQRLLAIINETRSRVNTLESKENVLLTATQTLTNKTLTTPTVADFTNAQHAHTDAASGGTIAHSSLTGLTTGDPHTQYALLAGRSGGQSLSGGTAANDDLTLQGTTNSTRTTSYVIMQPNGGDVGIGTTSPNYKLHLYSNANEFIFNYIETGSTGTSAGARLALKTPETSFESVLYGTNVTGNIITGVPRSKLAFYSVGAGGSGLLFHTNDSVPMIFATADTERMRILGTGNVGIGTASPSTRLDIDNGALELAEMTTPGAGAANTVRIYAVDNGAGKTQLMAIFNTGAAQQLAIQP